MNLTNALYRGPRLLVPILIDAMVIDQKVLDLMRGDWARNQAEYGNTLSFGEAFPRENAVARSTSHYPAVEAPGTGVHLQWVLPKGLCSGQLTDAGDLEFPLVPNRWLVVRCYYGPDHRLQVKGWVVQSDFLRETNDGGGSPVLHQEEGEIRHRQIGRVIPWEDWTGESDYERFPLTIVGSEDFAFSTYTVNNKNVFSMHDDLADLDTGQPYDIGYLVTGWYGDPIEDPFHQVIYDRQALLDKLENLRLDLRSEYGLTAAETAFAVATGHKEQQAPLVLCHGSIHSIEWPWKALDKDGRPERRLNLADTVPDIIVGNSGFDTLSAFIGQKLREYGLSTEETEFISELLYAFDQKLLKEYTEPGGDHLLDRHLHQSWFINSKGGSYWEIIQDRKGDDDLEKEALAQRLQSTLPTLAELNKVQDELDRLRDIHQSRLQHLYTALFAAKSRHNATWRSKAIELNNELKAVRQQIVALRDQSEQRREEIKTTLAIRDGAYRNDFELKQYPDPGYWEADDPVILVHAAKTGEKHSFDGPPSCRYSGQWIEALRLRQSGERFAPEVPALPQARHLPKEVPALIREFILLNPKFTPHYFGAAAPEIQKQQTLIWNTEQLGGLEANRLLQRAGFESIGQGIVAQRPDFRSFTTFTLPWSPLFMDWVVYYFPDQGKRAIADSHCRDALTSWQLEEDHFDYTPKPNARPPVINNDIHRQSWTIKGRSLISSHLPGILTARLREFQRELLEEEKKDAIETVIDLLQGFDLITQRLIGFNEYLQRYDIANQVPAALLRDEAIDSETLPRNNFGLPKGTPTVEFRNGRLVHLNGYYPIRSGHLLVHHVRVVDEFGIGFYPTGSNEPTDGNVLVAQDNSDIEKGRGMDHTNIADSGLVQLTPRLTQPARLTLSWIDADTGETVRQEAQNSPVCGWIVPNHLDKSLMIFDAAGKLQGSLIFFQRGERYHIRKALDPVSANPRKFEIKNRHLAAFINELLALEDSDTALSAFLEQIDKTTWITDPLGARNKQGLSALIGRPMALVRAQVRMDLQGLPLPAFDFGQPAAYDTSRNANPLGLMDVDFPYHLGSSILPDNGLIGYFDEVGGQTSYRRFYVVTDHSSIDTDYITDQQALSARLNHAGTPAAKQHIKNLSLLLDYRGGIHLISGLLPVFELNLPPKYTRDALANMEVTFRTGPLLVDPARLRMPKPNDISGKLSWIHQGVKIWQEDDEKLGQSAAWENKNIGTVLTDAHYPEQRHRLSEGWLKLSEALKPPDTAND